MEAYSQAIGVFAQRLAQESVQGVPEYVEGAPPPHTTGAEQRAEDLFQNVFEQREALRAASRRRMRR